MSCELRWCVTTDWIVMVISSNFSSRVLSSVSRPWERLHTGGNNQGDTLLKQILLMSFNTLTLWLHDGTTIHQWSPYVISTDVNTTFKLFGNPQPQWQGQGSQQQIETLRAFYILTHYFYSALKLLWRAECMSGYSPQCTDGLLETWLQPGPRIFIDTTNWCV